LSKGNAARAAAEFEGIGVKLEACSKILPIPKLVGIARIALRTAFAVHEFV
jgi:hypothetical protein